MMNYGVTSWVDHVLKVAVIVSIVGVLLALGWWLLA